jgi:prepilin-type N-terminal cleavage/methylation domain-containing protein
MANKGFTLIELLLVLAMLGIVVGVVFVNVNRFFDVGNGTAINQTSANHSIEVIIDGEHYYLCER